MAVAAAIVLLRLLSLTPACLAFLPPGRAAMHDTVQHHLALPLSAASTSTLPKAETGVLSLLKEYPEADGRGVKIAILDTGCDLAAAGLQITSDGKPKYLDFLDCTGDGDIDMKKVVNATDDKNTTAQITGLSGKNLTLGDWSKGVSEFRVGALRLFEFLPKGVENRIKKERRQAFEIKHHAAISDAQRKLDDFIGDDKVQKKEMELLLEQLQEILDSYEDSGPLLDVLLFKDAKDVWRAVLDLEATGNLSAQIPMAPFAHENQIGDLGYGSAVTFCVQVYEEGDVLSVVTDAGSHGTHVAGIAAANFVHDEDTISEARLNGVAPGAQILACKIGDGRLGSAETGTGLVRALIAAKKYGCDLVNLSFGEPAWQPDSGRVSQTFSDAVHKWGMTVFTSAGNDGPALSSLGSPGTLTAPITVGAYVSPEMMMDQYSTLEGDEELQGTSYHFSSRGPTPDGALPDLCAPGGAIAPVPRHALQGKSQYHGTSMSSPNACGVAACVLSALKQNGLRDFGPIELKRALLNSATPVDISDPWAQGAGLICAPAAVKYALAHHGKVAQDLFVDVKIPGRDNARGIYIRDAAELEGPLTFSVSVEPMFVHANERTEAEMEELLSLELELDLKPSASWVKCPSRMTLLSGKDKDASFSIRLEPNELPAGVHFATVDAIDASDSSRGSIFSLPITVIIPHAIPSSPSFKSSDNALKNEGVDVHPNAIDVAMSYELTSGSPSRRFLSVPQNAEWATIKLRGASPNPSGTSPLRFMIHAVPFARGDLPNTYIQLKRLIQLNEGVEKEFHMKVKGGSTLEICLQLLWLANSSPASILADVEFHSFGTRPQTLFSSQPVTIPTATEFARIGAGAPFRSEKLNPAAFLDQVHRTIRPSKQSITAASADRDILPPSDAEIKATQEGTTMGTQIYNMNLEYPIEIEGKDAISVTPRLPSLFHQLYDSPIDSQLWVLEDSNGANLGYGGSMHEAAGVKLKKGSYTLKLLLRHPDRNVLEKLKNIPLRIALALPKPLTCVVYSELDKASTPGVVGDGREPFPMKWIRRGAHQDLYIARPVDDLPDWISPGDTLVGSFRLDKSKIGITEMQLTYNVPPKPVPAPKDDASDDKDEDEDDEENALEEGIFDAKLKHLAKLRSKKKFEAHAELFASLKEEKPESIPLLSEGLSYVEESKAPDNATELEWRARQIASFVDSTNSSNGGPINEDALAQFFGCNQADDDEAKKDKEAKKLKKSMEEQRKALREGLFAKAVAIGNELASKDTVSDDEKELLSSAVKDMKKWLTSSDLKDDTQKARHAILLSREARICQNKAVTAVSLLRKESKDHENGMYEELTKELITVYKSMGGMDYLISNTENELSRRFPVAKQQL